MEVDMITEIPKQEFEQRIAKMQKEMAKKKLDALITFGNEAEPANVRYLSDYWPAFETAGVIIPKESEPALIVGPESLTYAEERSKIKKIRKVLEYRESSEPEYPGVKLTTFQELFDEALEGKSIKRLGMVGHSIASIPVYEGIKKAIGKGKIVKADDILLKMRMIKSENEILLMKQAFKAAKAGIETVLSKMKPGMTELEVVGIAQEAIYSHGAEYEGHPLYVLAGNHSNQAISRATHRKLKEGEVIQLNIGARVGGYSSSIGRPVCFGSPSNEIKNLFEVGLESGKIVKDSIKAGVVAKEIAAKYISFLKEKGYQDWFLYGPCHATGLMECEPPWIESSSEYPLKENMTFQVDCFLHNDTMGARWESGIRVTRDGIEELTDYKQEIIVL